VGWIVTLLLAQSQSQSHLSASRKQSTTSWNEGISFITNPQGRLWPEKQATSPAIPCRRIGCVDGLDRARFEYFSKKSSNFTKINPHYKPPLNLFCKKKTSNFTTISLQSRTPCVGLCLWAWLPPCSGLFVAGHGPRWAEFSPTSFFYFPANLKSDNMF
jgi:hypothetical protein